MQASFFQAAHRGKNEFFRYLITIMLVIGGVIIGQVPLGIALMMLSTKNGMSVEQLEQLQQKMDFSALGMDQNLALFLMLLAFAVGLLALLIGVKFIHGKRIVDVLSGRNQLDWKRVFWAFGCWFILTIVFELLVYAINPGNYSLHFDAKRFMILLPIALIMLPLQTSFEEVLFRGYLMQGTGLLFKHRLPALILTAVGFGALHFANPEVGEFGLGLMMTYYIGFGLLMGVCTLMDEGTELALGLHAATNIYGATIVSFSGSVLETPTIFRIAKVDAGLMGIVALAAGLIFLFMATRKYAWKDWGKLLRKIDEPNDTIVVSTPIQEE